MDTDTSKQQKIAIIGAGLGGLACAICLRHHASRIALHKKGYNVQVYEKAEDFRPVGGGLGLLPNGLKSLDAIESGIVESIKNSGCHVKQTVLTRFLVAVFLLLSW